MKNRTLLICLAIAMTASMALTGCFGQKKDEEVVVEESTFPEEDSKKDSKEAEEATATPTATPTVKPTSAPADQKTEDQLDGTEGVSTDSTDTTDETASGSSKGITPSKDNPDNSDTNLTRTIYRNSDGQPIVISADGNGGWVDEYGNVYRFADNEIDVYDQDDVDYYWHGEAADVYYMPIPSDDAEE